MIPSRLQALGVPLRSPCPPPEPARPAVGGAAGVAAISDDHWTGGYLPETDRGIVFAHPPGADAEPVGGGAALVLRQGSRGQTVARLQRKLKEAGFDAGSADGVFGPRTKAAVADFQKAKGLKVDGVVGPRTLEALDVAVTSRTLKAGTRGSEVRMLQKRLRDAGHNPGPVDGVFGPKTKAAVLAYQRFEKLGADGVVGPKTWGRLGVWQVERQSAASTGPGGTINTAAGPMVRRKGHLISVRVADRFDRLDAAARSAGINLQISSGYRSYQEQVVLWNRYGRDPNRVAPPGHSNHQTGTAIDFANTPGAWAWLKANASKYGFHNYPPEPWHYSLDGQ